MDYQTRVKVRFIFQQFTDRLITPEQLKAISAQFGLPVVQAAENLIRVCIFPEMLAVATPCWDWTDNETMLAIASVAFEGNKTISRFLKRSCDSRRSRIARVVQDLRRHRALDEVSESKLEFQRVSCFTIYPGDGRSYQGGRITQGMRCSRALQKLQVESGAQNARLYKTIHSLNRRVSETEEILIQSGHLRQPPEVDEREAEAIRSSENGDSTEQHNLCTQFLIECSRNKDLSPYGRRYSELLCDLSELLRATSRKTYHILRRILPLPYETSLYYKYASTLTRTKTEVTDLDGTIQRLEALLTGDIIKQSSATIGIDAFSFRTFAATTFTDSHCSDQEYSNAFIFLHIPLDADQAPVLLHLQKKSNGSYDATTAAIFEAMRDVYRKHNVPIWFKATDGDRYVTPEHEYFFSRYVQPNRADFSLLLQAIHEALCNGETMPIADPLHFAKNIRGRIIDHRVALVDHSDIIALVELEPLQRILKLGDALDDHSQLGRMRDVYVTQLFTLQNVCTLLEANYYAAALLFLPYSCLFTLLYCTNITNETRFFLAKLAYLCFSRLLDEAEKLTAGHSPIKHRFCAGAMAVTIAEPGFIKRMLHSCVSFGLGLTFGPNVVRLDAMGTHLVENAIGVARSTANSTRYAAIISAFATAEIRKELARKYKIPLHIPRRINDGGAKVNTLADDGVQHPEQWDANDISSMFVELCNHDLMKSARMDLQEFLVSLKQFVASLDITELPGISEVSNALIIQRNYKFKSEK